MGRRSVGGRFGTVVFDCDSTLSAIEGVDELAGAHRAEIVRLTESAMLGDVALEEVYGRRLALIQPTRAQVAAVGALYVERLVPDAMVVVRTLRDAGVRVCLMSGGLRPAIQVLALALGIPPSDVEAVDIRFDASGRYLGYDDASPLARAGGKLDVLVRWRAALPAPIMLVGDGATDLEASPAADLFVAFAGVADRVAVTGAADVVVRARSLAPILPLALGGRAPGEPAARRVYDRGLALLDADIRRHLLDTDLTHQ